MAARAAAQPFPGEDRSRASARRRRTPAFAGEFPRNVLERSLDLQQPRPVSKLVSDTNF
jgi:hypothetical protein